MPEKRNVKIGDPAPDVVFLTLDGRELRLSDYRGKRVILFVWASWELCREQLVAWQRFYLRHQGEPFELIAVAMDGQGVEVVRPFVEEAGATFQPLGGKATGQGLVDVEVKYYLPNEVRIDLSEHGWLTLTM